MQDNRKGYDPAPPGKYPIKKAIVDSDLDGIISGAMLRIVYPEIQFYLCDASSLREGMFDDIVDKETVIVDLPFYKSCGLYFDHHPMDDLGSEIKIPGRWKETKSAGRIIYDYFKGDYDLSKFDSIVKDLDKLDSGDLSLYEFLNPSDVIKLGLSVDRLSDNFNLLLIEYLALYEFSEVFNNYYIQVKIASAFNAREKILKYVRNNSIVKKGIVFTDVSKYPGRDKISSFMIASQYPNVSAIVVFKKGRKNNVKKVRMYKNGFNKKAKPYNLLEIAQQVDSKAGGHIVACGFQLSEGQSIEEISEQILKEIP